jgi:hemolysin III
MEALAARFKDPVSGLSHLAGFVVSLFAGGLLVGATQGAITEVGVSLIFATTTALLYLASAIYHLVIADERVERKLHLLDRAAIFLMIAGTSTPYFYYAYEPPLRGQMLSLIWALALIGVAFKLLWLKAPRFLYVGLYLAMGWVSIFRFEETVAGLGPKNALPWLIAGGLAYTAGAVIYALKRPNISRHFGFHELWHMFVLLGTACHYVGIYVLSV